MSASSGAQFRGLVKQEGLVLAIFGERIDGIDGGPIDYGLSILWPIAATGWKGREN